MVPPTGEGVNSGLEDAFLLAEYDARGSATWFADFEAARLPDLAALGEYATVLKDNLRSTDPVRGGADVVVRIVDSVAARLHLPSARIEDRLFGYDAGLTPYRDAIGPWIRERRVLFPIAKGVVGGVRRALGTDPHHSCGARGPRRPHRRACPQDHRRRWLPRHRQGGGRGGAGGQS